MTDHYQTLGVDRKAEQHEIATAAEELLAVRKAKRQRTADVHAALAVLGDPSMRKAYDLVVTGKIVGEKAGVVIEQVRDAVPDVDLRQLSCEAKQLSLKVIVLLSRMAGRTAESVCSISRWTETAACAALKKQA